MKSERETLGPTRVKLTVEVPFEDLKPNLDAAYKAIGNQIQVPGFRRGKVPTRIIDQRIGKGAVVQEAVNEALPQFYGQALEEHDVRPLGQPQVDVSEVPIEDGQPLKFSAEVDCRPEITLPEYAGLPVTVDPVTVSDEEVDARLESLRERFGTLTGVEREVATGDFVTIDLAAEVDGEQVDTITGVSYEVGSDNMLEGLDEALVGMSAGEDKNFTAALAGGDFEGREADCTVTVQAVKQRELPELTDEFAALASEFDTLEELKADLTKEVERASRLRQGLQARDKLIDALVDLIDIPVPEGIVEQEVISHLEGESRLDDTEHRAEVETETRKSLKVQFFLDAVVDKEQIEVGQPELIEYLVMTAQQYGMDPSEFARMLDSEAQLPGMVAEVGRRKALARIMEQAVVTDTEGNAVDLLGGSAEDVDEDGADLEEGIDDADNEEGFVEAGLEEGSVDADLQDVDPAAGDEVVPASAEDADDATAEAESDAKN